MLSWTQRRKFVVFFVIFFIAIFIAIFFALKFYKLPTPIPLETREFNILWSRFFKVRDGFVDAVALLENPNYFNAEKIIYSFKIYDKNNILITIKEGETFARPLERFAIFEPNIFLSEREPTKVILDIKNFVFLQSSTDSRPKIDVLSTEKFLEDFFPRVLVKVKNREEKFLENIEATIILFDENQNAIAVSQTHVPFLGLDEERILSFTWPKVVNGVSFVEVFFR